MSGSPPKWYEHPICIGVVSFAGMWILWKMLNSKMNIMDNQFKREHSIKLESVLKLMCTLWPEKSFTLLDAKLFIELITKATD